MQTSLKKILKQAKPDAEMRPAEEPGAIIPHAGIRCATKGTKVMKEGPSVGIVQANPSNNPMLLWAKAMVVSN